MAKSTCSYHVYDLRGNVVGRVRGIEHARKLARATAQHSPFRHSMTAWVERICGTATHRKRTNVYECIGPTRCRQLRRTTLRFRK